MKKRNLIILIILFVCVNLIIFYFLYPSSPLQNVFGTSPEQGNETQTPWELPNITIPGSSSEPSSGGAGGAGGEGGEGSGGAGGAGGGGEEPEEKPLVNYTLYIDSIPSNLTVFVNYSVNRIIFNISQKAPYSLEVDGDSTACVLASGLTGSGTLKFLIDGEECQTKMCHPPWSGCEVLMDSDHVVVEHWAST